MADDFVHLHVHSEYSLLDGLGRVPDLAKQAAALGQPALALTDHGVMHGAIEFARACRAEGVKPLLGVEAYLTLDGRSMEGRDPELDRNRHHLLLLAMNMTGYRNLLRISSDAQLRGFYHRPRIDSAYLAEHNEGLICTSGCLASELPTLIKNGREEKALDRLHWYRELFGPDRWYIEFQEHDIPELSQVNRTLFDFARRFEVPMVVTNDVHYVKEEDAIPHDMLLCVQTNTLQKDATRMRMSGATYFLKSAAQMRETFLPLADLPDSAFTNTLRIMEMCDVNPDENRAHLPEIAVPEGHSYQTFLHQLTVEGLRWRYGERAESDEIRARTDHELKIIHDMGFDSYYLIVWDLCDYARRRGIWWNVRGSGAGSIVAYAIGVTNLDPLRNKLIFERFLNPARVTMPDFDLDFPDDQREELIRYTLEKYGSDRVAQVVSFGRMKARAAVRDVGRAMDVPLTEVDALAKMIPAIPGKPVKLREVLTPAHEMHSADLLARRQTEPYVEGLLDMAADLEGVARHASIHPAAVVIADRPLTEYTPLMRAPKSAVTETITQYEFPVLESIGLLKVDFLGLSTLTLMREVAALIEQRHGVSYTLDTLPIDDPAAYALLTSGDVLGVFQVEGQGMRRVVMDMRPSELDHITAVISLFRPGPMEYIPQFIKVLHNEAAPVYTHSLLEQILKETMGVCVYQEQVIQILTDVAGYSAGEADLVRRAISKKSQKTLDEHREIFARGARERSGLSLDEGYKIWAALDGFARYGFNRAHAADYAVIVAQTAYLKATYPVEYMAALLTVERHDTEKVGLLIAECRRMGIEVLPPNVNVSGHTFTIERLPAGRVSPKPVTAYPFPVAPGDAIRMGLDAIKNVGEGAVDLILQARASRQGTFKGLSDFVERVDLRLVNRRGLECLIKVGALEDFGPRGQLLAGVEAILQASSASHEAAEAGQLTLFGGEAAPVEVDLRALAAAAPPVSEKEALAWEKELVGVYVSAHPLQRMTVDLVNVVTHSASEITEELDKSAVVIAGMITDARPLTTKKGDTMAFVRLEDLQGAVEVTVFPQLYKDQRALWAADKIVIVGGKADLRNGRVSVVADWVQDYVEGVKVIEDTGTVGYRYAKGSAARSRPALRGEFASSQGDDPDETAPEENPFALEPPAWLDAPAPPAPGEATAGPGAPKQESPQAAGPTSAPVLPTEALGEQEPVPSRTAEEVAGSRILTVSFRRTQSLETDRRRLGELVDLLVRYPGDDRFEIVIEAGRGARYHLDFPNNHTRVCTELLAALGAMGVRSSTVEGAA